MAGRDGTLRIKVVGDISHAAGEMEKLGGKLSSVGTTLTKGLTLPILGAGAAAVKLAMDAEQTDARLSAAFKSMGANSWTSLDTLQKKAEDLMSRTTFDDDAVKSAQAVLLTFGNVTGSAFDSGIESALNMSAALGTDLQSAAIQVGKALNDPVQGVTALTRAGVSFTQQQKDQIKAMSEAGDVAGAQAIVLGELKRQFGGVAEELAKTDTGQMQQAMNELAEAGEDIGKLLLPVIREFAGVVKDLARQFQALDPNTKRMIVQIAAIAAVIGPVLIVGGKMLSLFGSLTGAAAKLIGGIDKLTGSTGKLGSSMTATNVATGALGLTLLDLVTKLPDAGDRIGTTFEAIGNKDVPGAKTALQGFLDLLASNPFTQPNAIVAQWGLDSMGETAGEALVDSFQASVASHLASERAEFVAVTEDVGAEAGEATATAWNSAFARAYEAGNAALVADAKTQKLLDRLAQVDLQPFYDIGAAIPGELGRGMQDEANQAYDAATTLRDILENGTSPQERAKDFIKNGADYVDLIEQGLNSKKDGALETARELAIGAIGAIAQAGLDAQTPAGKKGLKAVGAYFDELLASGLTGEEALAALNGAGIDSSSEVLAGIRSKYPQFFSAGSGATDQVVSGINYIDWHAKGIKVAAAWIGGFRDKFEAYNWANLINSTIGPYTSGQSPPQKGPLHFIDKWGRNVGQAWIDGFALAFGSFRGVSLAQGITAALGVSAPGLTLAAAHATAPSVEEHHHWNIGTLVADEGGLDELERRMEQRRALRTRGGVRLAGSF